MARPVVSTSRLPDQGPVDCTTVAAPGQDPSWLVQDIARMAAVRRVDPTAAGARSLERLTDLATRLLGVASAQVSLLGETQVAVAGAGLGPGVAGTPVPLVDSMCAVAAVGAPEPMVVVDARADPRVAHMRPVLAGEIGAYLGVPLADDDGLVVGALCVYQPEARTWTESDVFLVAQLADSVSTELELTALSAAYESSRLRSSLAIDAAGIGSFDWDLRTGQLTWDDQSLRLFGMERADFPGTMAAFDDILHPDDRPRVRDALRTAVDTVGSFEVEYRIRRPSGETRWVMGRGRALANTEGVAVRVLGAGYDSTSRREGDARLTRVLEAMSAAFYSLDREWRFTYVNAEAERLLGRPREELLGGELWELLPHTVGSPFELHYRRAAEAGTPITFEAHYPAPLDGWFELRVSPAPEGLSVYFLEITERRLAEERARRSAARLALIAEATASFGSELGSGRGADLPLGHLARAVVPALADFCIVSVIDEDGRLRDTHCAHRDPDLQGLLRDYMGLRLPSLTSSAPFVDAMVTGRPVHMLDMPATIARVLPRGHVNRLACSLAPTTALAVPLVARGRTVGAMTLYRTGDRPPADADDQATAGEVGDRAALALDNARLYEQHRRMAEVMQRSLLTDPSPSDHAEIAVRYLPAVEAAQVGGDWYDAFRQPDGSTMIVIGDVVGHDSAAAAAMGQLRGLLRGIAYRAGAGPADVLAQLDLAMRGLQVQTMATAVVGRMEQTADERARGAVRLRWSSAGHPPVMVAHGDGRVAVLGATRADLMLGVEPGSPRQEEEVLLESGATVLLYTDGLVEGRDLPLDVGLARLRAALGSLGHHPLEELCDRLVHRLRPGGSEDDIALVAVRVHGPDGPPGC